MVQADKHAGIIRALDELAAEGKLELGQRFHIYAVPKERSRKFLMDSTQGLSEALELLEDMKDDVEWACINRYGRTLWSVRDGVATRNIYHLPNNGEEG